VYFTQRGVRYSHLNILGKRTMYLRQEGFRQEEYFTPGKVQVREIQYSLKGGFR
jgi:hypothetical protein